MLSTVVSRRFQSQTQKRYDQLKQEIISGSGKTPKSEIGPYPQYDFSDQVYGLNSYKQEQKKFNDIMDKYYYSDVEPESGLQQSQARYNTEVSKFQRKLNRPYFLKSGFSSDLKFSDGYLSAKGKRYNYWGQNTGYGGISKMTLFKAAIIPVSVSVFCGLIIAENTY